MTSILEIDDNHPERSLLFWRERGTVTSSRANESLPSFNKCAAPSPLPHLNTTIALEFLPSSSARTPGFFRTPSSCLGGFGGRQGLIAPNERLIDSCMRSGGECSTDEDFLGFLDCQGFGVVWWRLVVCSVSVESKRGG